MKLEAALRFAGDGVVIEVALRHAPQPSPMLGYVQMPAALEFVI